MHNYAVGKTRTIDRIAALAGILIGQQQLSLEIINSANFEATFTNNQNTYIYSLATRNRNIVSEILTINDVIKLKRAADGTGTLYYEQEGRDITFHMSDNRPIITSRRDNFQHSYLENLFRWADELHCYYFGSSRDMGQRNILATINLDEFSNEEFNTHETFRINELYLRAKREFGDNFDNKIISFMHEIEYDVSNLSIEINPNTAIVEEDKSPLYNIMSNLSSTILIDDIGEGLDFERSTKLITLLIELAENNDNIQLIMSTNDRYVMNKVPFKYWQLINRKGGECNVYNYQNSKEIFDEFKYTGLNNFDFLATDFINSEREQK